MLKKYYIIDVNNDVEFVGQFSSFSDAWDYIEYQSEKRYVWLIKEENLISLRDKITDIFNHKIGV